MIILIQARMTSRRLPGKVLMKLDEKVLLECTIKRLKQNSFNIPIAVITSDKKTDKPIEDFCVRNNIPFYKGSLENVLERFESACEFFCEEFFIRISGDSPLIDPNLVDKAFEIHKDKGGDLVTNIMNRTFPKGQSVEIISKKAIKKLKNFDLTKDEKEHVTLGFYKNKDKFQIINFETKSKKYSLQQQSIDTLDDFLKIQNLIKTNSDIFDLSWLEIYYIIENMKK